MKVWIDGTAFENARQIGVWRVFYEIMSRTSNEIEYTLWLRASPKQTIPDGVRVYRDNGRETLARYDLYHRMRRRKSNQGDPSELQHAHIFHSAGFTVPHRNDIKSVNTVYDMIAESHFQIGIRELEEAIAIKQESYCRACLLSCISDATASELKAFSPHLSEKTRVIPLGYEHLFSGNERPAKFSGAKSNDVLYIGNRHGYKNFVCVLQAMLDSSWPKGVNLNVVGASFSSGEKLWIKRHRLSDRVTHLGSLSRE